MRPPRLLSAAVLGALLLAAGCGSDATTDTTASSAGLANPASEHCVSQGGEVVIVTDSDGGQQGRCRLPDGTEVDEWELYRASQLSTTSATPAPSATTAGQEPAADFDVYLQAADVGPDCDQVVAVPRAATVEGPEADALAQLLAGPTAAEEAQGLGSWFSSATAGMLRSVVVENDMVRVDFDPALATAIPNASASCGSNLLLAQLDATIGQFGTSRRVVYSLGGDVDAFYAWLQRTTPAQ